MTSHPSALVAGIVCLSAVVAVVSSSWLAAGATTAAREGSSLGGGNCPTSCGGVDIPFPFGIGPDCCLPGFELACKNHKPFLVTQTSPTAPKDTVVEILNISLPQAEARVLQPINSYCYDAKNSTMVPSQWNWDLGHRSVFSFSSTANLFTVVGCRTLAYIGDTRGNDASAMYQTGCVAMCFEGKMSLNPCNGMGCCQTAIPKFLKFYQVWFDERLNTSGIDDGTGPCSFAVLMESSNFTSSTSRSSNTSSPGFINNNSPSEFNSSHGGKAPVVLDWSIGFEDCKTAERNPAGYACRSINSFCSDAASGRGYICKCKPGFQGNPYLRDDEGGCQDINECLEKEKYNCFGDCKNKIGSFDCPCPSGTNGDASIPKGCQNDPFPRGARIAVGISAGLLVALIAFLSTQVFLHKQNKKRQMFFEQHGGQMLSRILKTDGNMTFKLYDRVELEKATHGFHKGNIVGEGAHGAVYKATLSTGTTVAVKRCKQIDKTRTDEFVQELVVLCRVNHPNIVRLLGCCLHFEAPMLVYEFVPNGTLSDLLHGRPRRRVTLPTRLRIAAETAEALAHLHTSPHPTLHGDVKPQNILLGKGYVAKVSDFGCSTINDNVQVVPKGTLAYLDPEFLKDFQITDKTDVYSFGVVLIELLTGKNPQAKEWKNLTDMFQNSLGNGTLGDLLDSDIVEEGRMGLIYEAAQLVSRCIAVPGNTRPAMVEVAVELRRLSNEMPESPEARAALEVEDGSYSYNPATEGDTTSGFSNLPALSTELAR